MFKIKIPSLILISLASTAALAEDFTLTCQVKENAQGKSPSSYKVLFEIDIEPRYFKHFIEQGKEVKRIRDGFPHELDERRIVFTDDGNTMEYYDRQARRYLYKNKETGVEIQGDCTQTEMR